MIEILFAPLQSIEVFMQTGGTVLYWIFGAGVLLWTLILERYWFFGRIFPRLRATLRQRWAQRPERRSWSARRIRAVMIGDATLQMGLTLPLIQVLIAICPLLGLLGTVTGMIEVFDVMALDGTADARAMAAGVSRATVPTMAGMMVGLSGLFFINRFQKRVKIESERLGDALAYQ
ncbi:MAG: MotA/TolQ/ExbB proton channel family protein [Gammaproteobacteria bacterium]|jgi:biopolymer transport protein ExbB